MKIYRFLCRYNTTLNIS